MSLKICFFLIFSILCGSCYFQRITDLQNTWPIKGGGSHIYGTSPTRRCCIYFRSRDSIQGIAKFINYDDKVFDYIHFLPAGAKNLEKNIVRIKRKEIDFVRVYPDDESDRSHYMDYYYLGHKKEGNSFGWVFAKQGSLTVYVEDLRINYDYDKTRLFFYRLTVTNLNDTINSRYVGPIFRLHGTPKPADVLLKLINKRYKEHFKKGDFEDANAMAKYILAKENGKTP